MSREEVVFRSSELEAIWHPGDPRFLLVTFAEMGMRPNGRHWWGAAVARRIGCAALGFVAARPNWYPAAAVQEALAAPRIAAILAAHPRRLTYGFSMGGYGAIRHAREIGAEACLALAPQWSIDPAEVGAVDRRFVRHHDPQRNAGMAIAAGQGAGRTFVVVDPRAGADAWHVERIREALPEAVLIPARGTGHATSAALASSGTARSLFEAALIGDTGRMHREVHARRRLWPHRPAVLLRQVLASRPRLVLRILAQTPMVSETEAFRLRIRVAETLLRKGRHDDALAGAEAALATRPDSALALAVLADALFAHGDTERALACSDRSIAAPDGAELLWRHDRLRRWIGAARKRRR